MSDLRATGEGAPAVHRVEPTDVSEVESGERAGLQKTGTSSEDEDLFLEQCIPPAHIADWGEDEEESSVIENHQQNTSLLGTFTAIRTTTMPQNIVLLFWE